MKLFLLKIIIALILVSCTNGKNSKNEKSSKELKVSKEFYKNGVSKLWTKVEYDSFLLKTKIKNEGSDFKLIPEIVSEIQSEDSIIYTFELHVRSANNKLIGKPLPDFNFKDIDGKMVKLSELKGKPIIINLWFVECPPCIEEMPTLNSIKGRYANTDIQFLSMTYETKVKVELFLKKWKIDFRIIPEIGKYSNILDSNFPQTIFVNREGIITDIQNGMIPIYNKELKRKSEKMEETDFINALEKIK
jgi:cytochrome c biogenesis protein CcmG, thiol:disulfide interchange protein DsbE